MFCLAVISLYQGLSHFQICRNMQQFTCEKRKCCSLNQFQNLFVWPKVLRKCLFSASFTVCKTDENYTLIVSGENYQSLFSHSGSFGLHSADHTNLNLICLELVCFRALMMSKCAGLQPKEALQDHLWVCIGIHCILHSQITFGTPIHTLTVFSTLKQMIHSSPAQELTQRQDSLLSWFAKVGCCKTFSY